MSAQTLLTMLTYARPAGGDGERAFRERYLHTLPGAREDAHGNIHVSVGHSATLFCAHTDTVHREDGRVSVARAGGTLAARASCLGADDAVGVYVLRRMIQARVPGYYLFTYGEERGGIGARAAARADWSGYARAVAFDRRGRSEVITHQIGRRCASDTFARALADALALGHQLSARGIYTDTAEFAHVIPECVNIAAGYTAEHTPHETVSVPYVLRLARAACRVDWEGLPTVRGLGETAHNAYCDLCGHPFTKLEPSHMTCETCLFY